MPFASSGQLGPESDQERTARANLPCESRPAENRGQLDRSAKASLARIIGESGESATSWHLVTDSDTETHRSESWCYPKPYRYGRRSGQ